MPSQFFTFHVFASYKREDKRRRRHAGSLPPDPPRWARSPKESQMHRCSPQGTSNRLLGLAVRAQCAVIARFNKPKHMEVGIQHQALLVEQ